MRRSLPRPDDRYSQLKDDLRLVTKTPQPQMSSTGYTPQQQQQRITPPALVLSPIVGHRNTTSAGDQDVSAAASVFSRKRALPFEPLSSSLPVGSHGRAAGGSVAAALSRSAAFGIPVFTAATDMPMESQKQTLTSWMDNAARELSDINSSSVSYELFLQQITDAVATSAVSYDPAKPHPLRLAAFCTVAESMSTSLNAHNVALLRPVLDELYRSLYLPVGSGVPQDELSVAKMVQMGIKAKESAILQRFLARKTFFEEVEACHQQIGSLRMQIVALSSSKQSGRSVLDRLGETWRSTVQRMIFSAWRGLAVKSKAQNSIMSRYLASVRRRDALQTHFYAWRLVVKGLLLSNSRQQYAGALEQLTQQEATTHALYMEADDQLQESRMVVTRLKVEKDLSRLEREKFQEMVESSIRQSEGWRKLTIDVVSFLGTLRKYVSTPKNLLGAQKFQAATEEVTSIILGWAGKQIGQLQSPVASKVKLNNFTTDMKDGLLLVILMHIFTNGEIPLKVLQDIPDVKGRMQLVLDTMQNALGIPLALTIDDVFPLTPDMNFFLLFALWSYFDAPPLPNSDTAIGMTGSFRDDLDATTKYAELAKTAYPSWLEKRNLLQQYLVFVLLSRARALPSIVLSEHEAQERAREAELFSIIDVHLIPSSFMCAANLSPAQRFQNEEERQRTNSVFSKHINLLRHLFEKFAIRVVPLAEAVVNAKHHVSKKAAAKKKEAGEGAGGGNETRKSKKKGGGDIVAMPEPRSIHVVMETLGFLRICAAARIVSNPSNVVASGPNPRTKKPTAKDALQVLSEPRMLSKASIIDYFNDIASRFPSSLSAKDSGVTATPAAFAALLVHTAIARYGHPVLPSSMQPAPVSTALELLIQNDLQQVACFTQPPSFLDEFWHPSVQEAVLVPVRSVLQSLFLRFASAPPPVDVNPYAPPPPPSPPNSQTCAELRSMLAATLGDDMLQHLDPDIDLLFEQTATHFIPSDDVGSGGIAASSALPSPVAAAKPAAKPAAVVATKVVVQELRLLYAEFELFITSLALIYFPSPFRSLASKLTEILSEILASEFVQREILGLTPAETSAVPPS